MCGLTINSAGTNGVGSVITEIVIGILLIVIGILGLRKLKK